MKPLSDTCRDKALTVSSSPFFYKLNASAPLTEVGLAGAGEGEPSTPRPRKLKAPAALTDAVVCT